MIVADTSALVTLSAANVLDTVLAEFDVHATHTVETELHETAAYDDEHARAASGCLDLLDRVEVHDVGETALQSTRIDSGEASCLLLAREQDADFFLTDDLRALPELQSLTDVQLAISPIVLRALVERRVLDPNDAQDRLETIAETGNWFGAPIYRRARSLLQFDDVP